MAHILIFALHLKLELFTLRPLGGKEFFKVNLLTDWYYQFSFAIFSDRAAYQTNDKTSKIY